MRVIGITGGMASGKSEISRHIAARGFTVFDADACSRALTGKNGAALECIAQVFGEDFVKDGVLDRKLMSAEVFSDDGKRKQLEQIIHPMVIAECIKLMHKCANEQLFFIDAPLLIESGMNEMCDEVWAVYATVEQRIERAMKRSGLSREEAAGRIKSQIPFAQRKRCSSAVIDNSGALEKALKRTDALIAAALKKQMQNEKQTRGEAP